MSGTLSKGRVTATIPDDGPHWRDATFQLKGVVEPTTDVAILTYRAKACRRATGELYDAIVSSGYVKRNGAWKLAFHQQTPKGEG
jgi:hypothetical protein